jgi:hypothetical protein
MPYVMSSTGCGVPIVENQTKVYVNNMQQFYKISRSENELFFLQCNKQSRRLQCGLFSDCKTFLNTFISTF